MPASFETFADVDGRDCLLLVAFPTTGSAAPIAAHYLAKHLGLPLVGHLRMEELEHLMAVEQGRATSIVRLYGGEVACSLEHGCPRVYLVTTEVPMPGPLLAEVAGAVLGWARKQQAHLVLCLEGVVREDDDETPDVWAASSDLQVLEELETVGAKRAGRAMLGGISAHIVLGASKQDLRAAALLVEASESHPDGRAAAALISALDLLLPDVKVDAQPLLDEALELEKEMRKAAAPAQAMLGGRVPGMYV